MDRLRNRVEPFAALFWAPDPACRPGITYTSMSLYGYTVVGSIVNEEALYPPPLSYLGILSMYGLTGNQ